MIVVAQSGLTDRPSTPNYVVAVPTAIDRQPLSGAFMRFH